MKKILVGILLVFLMSLSVVFAGDTNYGDFADNAAEHAYAKDNVRITEVWANPDGSDKDLEFFEITNLGDKNVVLRCGKFENAWYWTNLHSQNMHTFGVSAGCSDIKLAAESSIIMARNRAALENKLGALDCPVFSYHGTEITLNNEGGYPRGHGNGADPIGDEIGLFDNKNSALFSAIDKVSYVLNSEDSPNSLHFTNYGESLPRKSYEVAEPTPCRATGGCKDADGDGYADTACGGDDCNDNDASRWQLLKGYVDGDSDGYGASSLVEVCSGASLPAGYVSSNGDCDDTLAWVNPGVKLDIPGDVHDANCDGIVECNPTDDWKNHGAYVKCVTQAANVLKKAGAITGKEKGEITSKAAKGELGYPITGKVVFGKTLGELTWLGLISLFCIIALVIVSITAMNKLSKGKKVDLGKWLRRK